MLLALAFAFGAFWRSAAEAADDSNSMTQTAPDAQSNKQLWGKVVEAAVTEMPHRLPSLPDCLSTV
jgi:hypothetical protein